MAAPPGGVLDLGYSLRSGIMNPMLGDQLGGKPLTGRGTAYESSHLWNSR